MKVSYQWLKEWVSLGDSMTPQKLGDLLTARGLEMEGLHRQDQGLEKVITAQIIHKEKHPEADRLSLCKVNPGTGEYLDIVCGAQNMKTGDIVALAQVGAHLPNGMKIEKGKIRGQVSMGMLCSESELGFAKESEGIIIFPEKTPIGWKIADVLGIDDTVLELKLTANRGDCLSHRGMAREVASALGVSLNPQKFATLKFEGAPGNPKEIKIELNAGQDCPQFFGAYLTGVKVGPSPDWLKKRIEAIGQRSINNIVDVSNFLMFELGFPVHIYDADKLEGGVIRCERAQKGAKLKLLDDSEVELTGEELVIVDAKKMVGLAGVMGGGNSEVSAETKNIFLECAEFNPTLVRRAAFRFNKRSEASLRFEKGVDPAGHAEAMARLVYLVEKISGGEVQYSCKGQLESRKNYSHRPVSFSVTQINSFLGLVGTSVEVSEAKMKSIFEALGCKVVSSANGAFSVTPPSYRLDLNIWQDFAEEIARTIGYDAIPTSIPVLTGMPKAKKGDAYAHRLNVIDKMKDSLASEGLSEGLSYSFQSSEWLAKFGFESKVKILNPLSEEQGYMVPSLLPGMMKAYLENERHHFGSEPLAVRLFEVRPVFQIQNHGSGTVEIKALSEHETGVQETWNVSVLISGPRFSQAMKSERGEVDFFDLKSVLEASFESLGARGIRFKTLDSNSKNHLGSGKPLFHPGQAAEIIAGKNIIGTFGRIHPKLEAQLKLKGPVFWAEFNLDAVIELTPEKERQMKAWSAFPTMERDFALLVKDTVGAESLVQSAMKNGKPIAKVVKIFDTYKGEHIPEGMVSIGVRVIFSDDAQSLEEKRVDECAQAIVKKWVEEFGAQQR